MGLGIASVLAFNTGTTAVPVWTEADLVADASVNASYEEGDASVRRTPVKQQEPTQMNLEITGRIRVDSTDDAYQLLKEQFIEKGVIDVLALNGPILTAGSHGWRFDAKCLNFSEDQSLGNVIFKEFSLKPCMSDNLPQYVMSTGGALTYTTVGDEVGS